jgi:hypothetical protein
VLFFFTISESIPFRLILGRFHSSIVQNMRELLSSFATALTRSIVRRDVIFRRCGRERTRAMPGRGRRPLGEARDLGGEKVRSIHRRGLTAFRPPGDPAECLMIVSDDRDAA